MTESMGDNEQIQDEKEKQMQNEKQIQEEKDETEAQSMRSVSITTLPGACPNSTELNWVDSLAMADALLYYSWHTLALNGLNHRNIQT